MSSRTTWRSWGAFGTMVALAAGCFGGWLLLERPSEKIETSRQSYPVKEGRISLDMLAGRGTVEVLAGRPGEVQVERVLTWDRAKPQVTQSWERDTLKVGVVCPTRQRTACSADYRVLVPPDAAVTAAVGNGPLAVTGVHGKLDLTVTKDDDVLVSDVSGALKIRSRDGRVVASGLRSPTVDVQVREGELTLAFAGVPTAVTAVLVDGSLSIDVPDEGLYRVIGDVTDGARTIDVETADSAPSTIIARVSSGNLRIR